MKAYLQEGLFVPQAWVMANPGVLAHFTYTFEDKVNFGYDIEDSYTVEQQVPMYRRVGEFYEFARGDLSKIYKLFGELEIEDRRSNVPMDIDLRFTGRLRDKQKEGIRQFIDPNIGGIFQAAPAFGKTVVMVALACLLKQKLLLLVNKVDLREQFMDRMREHTNITELEKAAGKKLMGELYYEDGQPMTYPITVATYQLIAYEEERLRKIKDLFGLVLVDECHRAPADCLTRIVRGMNPLLHIGVSATPRRKDGYHRLLPDLIGPVRFKADVVNNCDVQIMRGAHFPVPNNVNFSKLINIVCKHTGRNRKIVDNVINDINKEGRRVIILTQRVEHSEVLWNMLKQENVRARRISADCSKEEKEERIQKLFALDNAIKYLREQVADAEEIDWQLVLTWEDFWSETKDLLEKTTQEVRDGVRKFYDERADCLVTTTKLFGEGSDIPPIDTLHLVCPTADDVGMEQMIGRIQREFLRKKSPKAVYYADSGHGILYGCTKKFKRVCEEQFKYSVEDKSDQVFQEGVLL